jgi:hypothetical protein
MSLKNHRNAIRLTDHGLTKEEEKRVLSASHATWNAIGADIEGICESNEEVVEMIFDADRLAMFGGLDKALLERVYAIPIPVRYAWLGQQVRFV